MESGDTLEWLNQQSRCTWRLEEYGFFCVHGLRLSVDFVERARSRGRPELRGEDTVNLDAAALERMGRIQRELAVPELWWHLPVMRPTQEFLRAWCVELAERLIAEHPANIDAIAIRDTLTGESSLRLGPRAYTELG